MLFDDGMKKLFIQLKVIKLCSFVKKLSLINILLYPWLDETLQAYLVCQLSQ